jgi:transposase
VATVEIARRLAVRPGTVSKWRTRFAEEGLAGLDDAPRSGAPAVYDERTERRILARLDQPVPGGETVWTARLIAAELGDVSLDHVWRILRKHGIHLERRRSWCISTDPAFARKAADIVGLYLAPPDDALVLWVDENMSTQPNERAQGYLRLYDGTTARGFSCRYQRHGMTTLGAALEVAAGMIKTGHYRRTRRREFLDFLNHLVSQYPSDQELHVIVDNVSTHTKKGGAWRARHPNVHFHYTPTTTGWLTQIEVWFSILTTRVVRHGSFTSARQLRQAISRFTKAYNEDCAPFEWIKPHARQVSLKQRYGDVWK